MPTPKEIAVSEDSTKQNEWLLDPSRTPREIIRFIAATPFERRPTHLARDAIAVRISEEQTKSAEKVENQTDKLISLTRWIVALTFALLFLTAFLCYDAYHSSKRDNQAHPSTTQK